MDKHVHPTLYWTCDYLSMLGLKLIHVSKRGPWTSMTNSPRHVELPFPVKGDQSAGSTVANKGGCLACHKWIVLCIYVKHAIDVTTSNIMGAFFWTKYMWFRWTYYFVYVSNLRLDDVDYCSTIRYRRLELTGTVGEWVRTHWRNEKVVRDRVT